MPFPCKSGTKCIASTSGRVAASPCGIHDNCMKTAEVYLPSGLSWLVLPLSFPSFLPPFQIDWFIPSEGERDTFNKVFLFFLQEVDVPSCYDPPGRHPGAWAFVWDECQHVPGDLRTHRSLPCGRSATAHRVTAASAVSLLPFPRSYSCH